MLYKGVRKFFDERGYLEVETPVLSSHLIPEPTIENFSTLFSNEFVGSRELFLVPSPEVFMKQLLSEGSPSIYQISKCFRNAEQLGALHNPEFTMLEYYTKGFDERDSIRLTEELFAETAIPGCPEGLKHGFEVISMAEALQRFAGVDLEKVQDYPVLRQKALDLGLLIDPGVRESWADTFNRIFINFVEPKLVGPKPVVVTDYPRQIECLALDRGICKQRWELYYDGVEIANCYAEETERDKVEAYYRKEYAELAGVRSRSGSVIPDVDDNYGALFNTESEKKFPACSGVAIGMDRLLMVECEKKSIEDLILFSFSDIIR